MATLSMRKLNELFENIDEEIIVRALKEINILNIPLDVQVNKTKEHYWSILFEGIDYPIKFIMQHINNDSDYLNNDIKIGPPDACPEHYARLIKQKIPKFSKFKIIHDGYDYKTGELINNDKNLLSVKDIILKENDNVQMEEMLKQPKNQILYGPPGTGKTYNTVVEVMKIISYKDFFCEWYLEEYCKKNNVKLPQKTLNDYINHLEKINLELLKNDSIFQYWNLSDFQNLKQKILDSPYIQDYSSRSNPNSYFNHALKRYSEFLNDLTYKKIKNYFDKLKKQGQIEFVTFHQSYSYEEFVEGIKPVLNAEQIQYEKKDGVFKQICESAGAKTTSNFDEVYDKFINDVQESEEQYCLETLTHKKKFAVSVNSNNSLNLLVGENLEKQGTLTKEHLKNRSNWKSYSTAIYQHLVDNYKLVETNVTEIKSHVLIIDEINRGNISKIFGELITLIEEDKRLGEPNEVTVKLPYSDVNDQPFGVPSNLYIIGTMNTSDRSIASVDIALRRRFKFKEMMPNENLINEIANKDVWYIFDDNNQKLYSVNLVELLKTLNERITILLDRDHQIGHSYFLDLIKDENGKIKENLTETELKEMWFSCIQPLLNEYFYGDWEKLQALLGKAEKSNADGSNNSFIKVIKKDCLLNGYSCDTNELCDFTHKDDIKFKEALGTAFKNAISYDNKSEVEKDANTTT